MNFKLYTVASIALSVAAMTGCVVQPATGGGNFTGGNNLSSGAGMGGSGDGGGSSGPSTGAGSTSMGARAYFEQHVYPALVSSDNPIQACASCHATGASGSPTFMSSDAEKSYNAAQGYPGIIAIPESSILILHGKHTGPALSPTQRDTVAEWLAMEAKERNLVGGGGTTATTGAGMGMGPLTLQDALVKFGACMDIQDWLDNNLDKLPNVATKGNTNSTCNGCHNTGDFGNLLNKENVNQTFAAQQQFPYVKRWVSGIYDKDGNFTGLKAVPRNILKGEEAQMCNPAEENCHPKYIELMSDEVKQGITNFIDTTLDRMAKNQCPTP